MPAKKPVRSRRAGRVCPAAALSPCRKGDLAEIAFLGRATALGYNVTKPFGHGAPYDFLIERGGRARRIQVKSAWSFATCSYCVNTRHCAKPYDAGIDFLVAYVAPCDAWYIIPARLLRRACAIRLSPHRRDARGPFERYREAWELLESAL